MCHNMPHPLNPTEGVIAGSQYMCYIGLMSLNCPSFNFPLSKSLSMCQGSQILLHLRPLRPQRFQGMMLRLKGWLLKGTKLDSQRWKEKPTQKRKALQNTCSKPTDKAAEKVEKLRQGRVSGNLSRPACSYLSQDNAYLGHDKTSWKGTKEVEGKRHMCQER